VTSHSQGLSGLTSDTLYHYRVKSRDATGNLGVSDDFTFRTAPPPDTTPPTVTSFSPAAGATNVNANANVTVTFSEAMDAATVNGSTVELRDPSNALVSATVSYNAASFTATLDPTASLAAGVTYTARVRGGSTDPRVKDLAGNALAADLTWTFTIASDTTPPTVTSFSPAAGATNVNANANVTVTFSEAMDAATVNGSTVELRDPSNALVPATVSYNAASFTATLDPTAPLTAEVTYTARVRGGSTDPRVKDVAGNSLAADVMWTFTTAQNGSGGIKWLVTDHLGSTRMVIDETGSLEAIERHDFDPFGVELIAGVGIRSENNGYSRDSVRQKFGSKEHDNETKLDFFGARYFSSVQGRFTSPDEFTGGPTELFAEVAAHNPTFYADTFDPQSLNKYTYCLNNPLKFVDPDGHQATMSDVLKFWGVLGACQACQNEVAKGALKELDNFRIGMKNSSPLVTGVPTPYNEPDNMFQDYGMTVTEHLTILGSFLGLKGQVNVAVAEGEGAAITTVAAEAEAGNTVTLTSNAARRAAMREVGMPTSQQPVPASQQIGPRRTAQGQNLEYDVPGKGRMAVQQTAKPGPKEPHGPHWEAGRVKPTGTTDALGRPRLRSDKSRVEYTPKKKPEEN
jgi:RHS repeat-associated protein